MELLQWVVDFIADIFDAEKISVTGESDGDGGRKKKRIISVSQ